MTRKLLRKAYNFFSLLCFYGIVLFYKRNIALKGRIIVKGVPIIEISRKGKIEIGKRVTLNSSNRRYHISMYSKCKLIADGEYAFISIGNNTRIHGSCIHAREKIVIGNNCLIAANTNIIDNNGHNLSFDDAYDRKNTSGTSKPVIIEDGVWIGAGCTILPGSKIGYGSVIGVGSVVKGEIPPLSLVASPLSSVVKSYKKD